MEPGLFMELHPKEEMMGEKACSLCESAQVERLKKFFFSSQSTDDFNSTFVFGTYDQHFCRLQG